MASVQRKVHPLRRAVGREPRRGAARRSPEAACATVLGVAAEAPARADLAPE